MLLSNFVTYNSTGFGDFFFFFFFSKAVADVCLNFRSEEGKKKKESFLAAGA